MKGKICLVTGANAGIGLETARGLAKMGATVVMACRSKEKGIAAQADIISTTNNQHVDLMLVDLASQKDIRRFAKEFRAKYPRLDVLVNNAGAFFSSYGTTEDGLERQWGINHVGPFLLTILLLDSLKAASHGARIVMVSSGLHYRGKINFNDFNGEKNYSPTTAYSQSKLANVLFANEFSRRFPDLGITANSLHPGGVRTNIAQKDSSFFYRIGWGLLKPFMISLEQGALTSLYVATSPTLEGVTGKYFAKSKEQKAAPDALDAQIAKRLWEETMKAIDN